MSDESPGFTLANLNRKLTPEDQFISTKKTQKDVYRPESNITLSNIDSTIGRRAKNRALIASYYGQILADLTPCHTPSQLVVFFVVESTYCTLGQLPVITNSVFRLDAEFCFTHHEFHQGNASKSNHVQKSCMTRNDCKDQQLGCVINDITGLTVIKVYHINKTHQFDFLESRF